MNLLLDSTVLIDALRRRGSGYELVRLFLAEGHQLGTSSINLGEIFAGARPEELERTTEFLKDIVCYPISCAIARNAGLLRSEWSRRGRSLKLDDMLIAATAIEHGLTLVTENNRDFPMPELLLFTGA